jgi:C4-dicarboxylate-specific signal transduction histidine kinase
MISKKNSVDGSIEQKRKLWEHHPVLAMGNARLAKLANMLGVEVGYVMDVSGNCIGASNATQTASFVGAKYAQREYFKSALAGQSGYQYAVGSVSKIPGLYFSAPIFYQGRIVGVAAAKLNVSKLASWIGQSEAMITDQYGVVILASDEKLAMHAMQESTAFNLSVQDRMARYLQNDFARIGIAQWRTPTLPQLKYLLHEKLPLLLYQVPIANEALTVYAVRRMPLAGRIQL